MTSKLNTISKLSTEMQNKETEKIDQLNTLGMLTMINKQDSTIHDSVQKELDNITLVTDKAFKTIKQGGRLVYIGAGTSGRLGVLDASEMPPTFGVDSNTIIAVIAGGDPALRNPIENAEDDTQQSIIDLEEIQFTKNDMLIGIAASGRTPYVVSALEWANKLGADTASISTSSDSIIGKIAKYKIEVIVGPETITGSTRMKSGTAQKLVLNMISSTIMIKLGKVYKNWMVDVKATNEKLYLRAINMIMEITGTDEKNASKVFEESGQSVKVSIIMITKQINNFEAKELLEKNEGIISKAIL